jgi:enamine deaminase RidA (YjgF/YER057c/UK114 family)
MPKAADVNKIRFQPKGYTMTASRKLAFAAAAALALCATALPASAQRIVHAGQDLYFFSGTTADPIDASNPTARGDTVRQVDNILNKYQGMLAKNGLTFGDVVSAHVFLVTDPAKGDIDFAGLNAEWAKRFGSATQPNRPSRWAIHAQLPTPGALVEIEPVAAKNAK